MPKEEDFDIAPLGGTKLRPAVAFRRVLDSILYVLRTEPDAAPSPPARR